MRNIREQWVHEGFVHVREMLSSQEVTKIRNHFMEWNASDRKQDFDKIDPTGQDPLAMFPRIIHPHRQDDLSLKFLLDARIQKVLVELLGDEPYGAQAMFYFKPPGARGQALHQDQAYLRAHPGTCVAAWLAVDDCDDENGCMSVVPRSHALPPLCHVDADNSTSFTNVTVPVPEGYEPVPVRMKAGDVLFFHGNLIHGSGPNRSTDRFRRSLIAHYITSDAKEAWEFYHPLLRFDGTEAHLEDAPMGSECGVVTDYGIEIVAGALSGPKEAH